MKITKVTFDESTFGSTGKSLRMLRNAVADTLHCKTLVLEIPTNDICCGFLVINKDDESAIWSGDGFRFDKGGEGGRGYLAAHKMLDTFGIKYFSVYSQEAITEFKKALNPLNDFVGACNKVAEDFSEEYYKCAYDLIPYY
jgi:hypothetical protein